MSSRLRPTSRRVVGRSGEFPVVHENDLGRATGPPRRRIGPSFADGPTGPVGSPVRGTGGPLPGFRGAPPGLLDVRRRPADRDRAALGQPPRGGVGRSAAAGVLCGARRHASRRPLRSCRLWALVTRARPATDDRVRVAATRGGDRCDRRAGDRLRVVLLLRLGVATCHSPAGVGPEARVLRRLRST